MILWCSRSLLRTIRSDGVLGSWLLWSQPHVRGRSLADLTCALDAAGTNLTNLACDYGKIDPSDGLGLQIAAISDTDPTYAGSCGCWLSPQT